MGDSTEGEGPGWRRALGPVALVAVGCALRLTGLGHHSIWFDEAGTLHAALAPDLVETIAGDRHPPLSHVLFRGWAALFGEGDAALRLLPALLSCLALAGFARLARGWLSERGALWATALAAVAPFLLWNAQEVRMYAFVELGTVAALLGTQAFIARSARVAGERGYAADPFTAPTGECGADRRSPEAFDSAETAGGAQRHAARGSAENAAGSHRLAALDSAERRSAGFPLGAWTAVALGTAFAFGSHYLGALVAASVGAIALLERRSDGARPSVRRCGALLAAPVVGLALWLPWLVAMLDRQLESDWGFHAKTAPRDLLELPARLVYAQVDGLPDAVRVLVLAGGAAVLVAVAVFAAHAVLRRRTPDLVALACLLAPIAAGLALTFVTTAPYFKARYLTTAAPGAVLCAGAGLALIPRWPRRGLGGLALASCVVLLGAHRMENRREDYRAACAELEEHFLDGDLVLAICHAPEPFAQAPVRHYLRHRPDVLDAIADAHAYFEGDEYPAAAGTRVHVIYREHDDAWQRLQELVDTHDELHRGERRIRIQHLIFEVPSG